jgi:hypothetical protein
MQYVPVVSASGQPLMPCHPARARELLKQGKAIRGFDRGLFYIKLLDREDGEVQPVAVGIDPGSQKEAFTVKSAKRTLLNLQADAVTWVKDAEQTSTQMRRTRRSRKTPYRPMRTNRRQGQTRLPPSTRARWGWKLRIARWLARYYPIRTLVVEDIKARPWKGKGSRYNQTFSPLQVGKEWFYDELGRLAGVQVFSGWDTHQERVRLGLNKLGDKCSDRCEAHCVDSWTLANLEVGGHTQPDNTAMLYLVPLRFHRRQLHRLQPEKGGIRKPYGGTRSLGLKRGAWVKHPRYRVCYVGGTTGGTISLHSQQTGERVAKVKPDTVKFLCTASWRVRKGAQAASPVAFRRQSPPPDYRWRIPASRVPS